MNIFVKTLFMLVTLGRIAAAEEDGDNDSGFFRYVVAFNPLDLLDLAPDIDIPFLDNLPIFSNEDDDDENSVLNFFQTIVDTIADGLGIDLDPPLFSVAVSDIFSFQVRVMNEGLAKALAELPFVTSVERDQRLSIDVPERQSFTASDQEILPYGIQMVGALDVSDASVANRKICIIDSGYDLGHADLPVSTVEGLDGGEAGPWKEDGYGHGTHVAGTIAAIGGNGGGVVGVNRNGAIGLYIVKFLNDEGTSVWGSDLIQSIQACVDNGSHIVSMSLGGEQRLQYEEVAFQTHYDNGVLFVAAAGNHGTSTYSYPASYPSVISVAAVDSSKNVADFSAFNDQVELSGPGVEVLSTVPGGGYEYYQGTSMACPHVSGVAALVWSLFPDLSAQEIRIALDSSAEDLGAPGYDVDYGYGLVRADLAVQYLQNGGTPVIPPPESTDPPVSDECVDEPSDWVDVDGDGCGWYSVSAYRCIVFGDIPGTLGFVASEACCTCGGGSGGDSTCQDDDWVDSDGDGCDFYEQGNNCEWYGNDYANDGQTASTACCACRGVTATTITSTTKDGSPRKGGGTAAFTDVPFGDGVAIDDDSASSAVSICLSVFAVVFVSVLMA